MVYSADHIAKIGNTIIYLADKIPHLYKTKLLKLLYILDEVSIRKYGVPFLNLEYEVWKLGPVSNDMYVETTEKPSMLKDYIDIELEEKNCKIRPLKEFNDDEFSDSEIELMDLVIQRFGSDSAEKLVEYTHRKNSPWYLTAKKHNVLEQLEKEALPTTRFLVDFNFLMEGDDQKKKKYHDHLEYLRYSEEIKNA